MCRLALMNNEVDKYANEIERSEKIKRLYYELQNIPMLRRLRQRKGQWMNFS